MKKIIILFTLFLSILHAADFAVISDLGASARSIGMGNIRGFSYSADTLFENPAGLTRIKKYNVSLFNTTLLDDVHYYSVALASNTNYGYFGVGIYEALVANIPETYINELTTNDEFAVKSTFDYKDSIFKIGYAYHFSDTMDIGFSGTYYDRSYYSVEGSSFDFDFGLLIKQKYANFSFVIENLTPGRNFKYNNDKIEKIPTSFYFSWETMYKDFLFYPQLRFTEGHTLTSLGTVYDPSYIPLLQFSFGYKQHLSYVYEKQTTGTIGVGLKLEQMSVNYSFEKSDYTLNDNNSYFSVNFDF